VNPWLYLDEKLNIVGDNLILKILMQAQVKYSVKTNLIRHFTQTIKKGLKQSCDKEINFHFSQNFHGLVGQGSYKA
jgi:hypothetical protein